jgi:Holliday junction resolvasome RuvABC endonuclease subunit
MTNHPPTVLAVNPGSRYLGLALFRGQELIDWGIRVIKKRNLEDKLELAKSVVSAMITQHEVKIMAIKQLHPCRTSVNLDRLAVAITALASSKGLRIYQYPLEQVETAICGSEKVSKGKLAKQICETYSFLAQDLEKEMASRNPYHTRMFEAVALGLTCLRELRSTKS